MTDLLEALVGEEVALVVEEEMRDGENRMCVIHSTKISGLSFEIFWCRMNCDRSERPGLFNCQNKFVLI